MGRLIPAGTGFAHHADRRRTREQDLADQLQKLEDKQAADAEAAALEEALVADLDANKDADAEAVAADESEAIAEGGEETKTA